MGFFGNAEETVILKEEEFGSRIMRIKDRLGETQLQRALKDKQKKNPRVKSFTHSAQI